MSNTITSTPPVSSLHINDTTTDGFAEYRMAPIPTDHHLRFMEDPVAVTPRRLEAEPPPPYTEPRMVCGHIWPYNWPEPIHVAIGFGLGFILIAELVVIGLAATLVFSERTSIPAQARIQGRTPLA